MIVVAIIALLAAIAVPGFMRARKRSQATDILNELRLLDSAVDQYAMETNKKAGDAFAWNDLKSYIKKDSRLYNAFAADGSQVSDLLNNAYCSTGYIDQHPSDVSNVALNRATYDTLSDVVDLEFWQPFGIHPGVSAGPAGGSEVTPAPPTD